MGNLAKSAIIGGHKVPFRLLPSKQNIVFDHFVSQMKLHYGSFAEELISISTKIIGREALNLVDIQILLEKASFPLLMKLVDLSRQDKTYDFIAPVPLVVVPISQWLRNASPQRTLLLAVEFVTRIPHANVRVTFDEFDFNSLEGFIKEVIKDLSSARTGLTFLGPSVDAVITWVYEQTESDSQAKILQLLEEVLHQLRAIGFDALRPAFSFEALRLAKEAGFENMFITRIDSHLSFASLAEELHALDEITKREKMIKVWIPGLHNPLNTKTKLRSDTHRCEASSYGANAYGVNTYGVNTYGVNDFQILRVLSVGALCLPHVPRKRASSRFLSLEGLQLALSCGANEFGFGAIDQSTVHALNLQHFEVLNNVIGQEFYKDKQ